ncbi:hypothetical protein TNCV_1114191 [Trichonephila clavipes]|nr:hypothetical protein TNCV_1114191 [Trichonephila clavipes]
MVEGLSLCEDICHHMLLVDISSEKFPISRTIQSQIPFNRGNYSNCDLIKAKSRTIRGPHCDRGPGFGPSWPLPTHVFKINNTTLVRLITRHTRAQRCVAVLKVYPSCPNCNVNQASPVHILACIGFHKSQLLPSPATVLHCFKTHGFMDLI